jgi:hypothetical protein
MTAAPLTTEPSPAATINEDRNHAVPLDDKSA